MRLPAPAHRALAIVILSCPMLAVTARADTALALAPSLGIFDAGKGQRAAELGLEVRLAPVWRGLHGAFGAMATSDEGGYVYAGARYDLGLGAERRWWLTPSFAVGAYRRGDGKDLGKTLEFRSGLEVAYQLNPRSRVGVTLYHLSNASLADDNPGEESLIASWSFLW